MDVDRIRALLGRGLPLRCLGSIDSTNTMAKQWARQGVPHGAAVLADRQTAGRGRLGRSFFSPEGGLYMSLIVDSVGIPPGQLTTLAAVAVLRAAEQVTGRQLHIKWVNDLLLDGRKVCGILTEGIVQGDAVARSVIGIGVNTGPMALPMELEQTAGSLHLPGQPVDREALAAQIIGGILDGLPRVPAHMADYRARCITLGQQVAFVHEGRPRIGVAARMDDDGALWIATPEGPLRLLAGEVSLQAAGPAGAGARASDRSAESVPQSAPPTR